MERNLGQRSFQLGLLLVITGALALLSNIGLVRGMPDVIGGLLFAAGGALLVRYYSRQVSRLWALIVGFGLFGLAAASLGGPLQGTYFLGLLGAGFILTYLNHRRNWWAIIPGGVLLSVGLVAGVEALFPRLDPGPVLFLGFAATFGYLYRLPEGGKRWAIYPALASVVIAIMALSFEGGWLVPVLLIAVGAYLLSRQSAQVVNGSRSVAPPAGPTGPQADVTAPEPDQPPVAEPERSGS